MKAPYGTQSYTKISRQFISHGQVSSEFWDTKCREEQYCTSSHLLEATDWRNSSWSLKGTHAPKAVFCVALGVVVVTYCYSAGRHQERGVSAANERAVRGSQPHGANSCPTNVLLFFELPEYGARENLLSELNLI